MRARGLWEVHLVTTMRALALCGVVSLFMLAVPDARADSDGVPTVGGEWTGKVTSVYWDQTNGGAARPKHKYKSKLDATIAQKGGAILITLDFDSIFPVDTGGGTATLTLTGNIGNYHLSGVAEAAPGIPAVALSGTSNKKGTKITLTGVAASGDFTHQIKIKIKRIAP